MELLNLLATAKCPIDIDPIVPGTIRIFVTMLKIVVPIILIVFGMLDMAKAVMGNEEKEMKEAQKKQREAEVDTKEFRVLYAIVIFFVVALVQFVFGQLADADGNSDKNIKSGDTAACISCFINSAESCSK